MWISCLDDSTVVFSALETTKDKNIARSSNCFFLLVLKSPFSEVLYSFESLYTIAGG